MSPTFIALALIAAVLIVNWRLVLLVFAACFVALILMGLGVADGQATAQHDPQVPTTAPAEPGQDPLFDGATGSG